MVDGQTQLVGLIGWPVEHSLSPAMHNAAFDALELNWHYVPLPVAPGDVEAAVRGLVALGFRGANVTVPHKQAVISMLDSVPPNVRDLGAVNTLVIEKKESSTVIKGDNTDNQGFIAALEHKEVALRGLKNAVVIGAGGAARAVVYALLRSGKGKIVVLNRTVARAQALIAELDHRLQERSLLRARSLTPETLVESARAADVPIPAHLTVFDLVYNPLQTRLLEQAQRSGASAISGLEMLVQQGALAFEMWTGKPAPVEVMRNACERALQKGSEAVRL
jgi:shikimate dehydrogenase